MATKKKVSPHVIKAKPKAKPAPAPAKPAPRSSSSKLENLAARPSFADLDDEQLVDHSGVFRVTSSIKQAQTGHDEDSTRRFPNDSLVMAAQRDNFREDGPTIDEAVDDNVVDDESMAAQRRERLATLAARASARTRPRR